LVSLKLSNLSHEFEDRVVFSGLSFEFSGRSLAVTGPNGSGKTTLLRILAGLLTPTSGRADVMLDGKVMSRADIRRAVGLAAPDARLYPELTPRENLVFLARARGLANAECRIAGALREVGLESRADDPVGGLSSGLRQRAGLAAAILHNPCVLLLDEPSTNLDESGVEMLHSIIHRRAGTGTVILATNDPTEADLAAERIELG
jgi:heme exporter protein A